MRKLNVLSTLFLLTLVQSLFAQSAGTNPQILLYRYNSTPGLSPQPVVQNDLLGSLKWTGLSGIGAIRIGASIQSFVTDPVSPGLMQANMIFRTSDAAGLTDRMIITEDGLVGIGTMTPQFNLHTVGNTHTTGRFHGRIHFDFVSLANNAPNTYTDEAYFERRSRSVLSVPAVVGMNDFGGILSLAPGGGAHDHQLFFGQDGIWNRREAENAGAWAGAWEKLLSSADIQGRKNLVSRFLPPDNLSSKLGESQLYDDGSNVVVGGIPAAPALATPVFDAANLFTVNGATRINGKTFVNGRLGVGNNTPTVALDVTGDANVTGNSATNSLIVATNTATGTLNVTTNNPGVPVLNVAGIANFNQPVKIGATNLATGYLLSVGGGIMAEEVQVRLQPWPDYVFEAGYDLMPLAEVEQYIRENKHLPGVKPAAEIHSEGLKIGETQKAQMEKIEELYLHVIALEKRIQALESENTALKSGKH